MGKEPVVSITAAFVFGGWGGLRDEISEVGTWERRIELRRWSEIFGCC